MKLARDPFQYQSCRLCGRWGMSLVILQSAGTSSSAMVPWCLCLRSSPITQSCQCWEMQHGPFQTSVVASLSHPSSRCVISLGFHNVWKVVIFTFSVIGFSCEHLGLNWLTYILSLQSKPALPALERLIHSNDEEVLTDACWALSYLSDGTNDKIQAVIEAGVCRRLVELLL